MANNDFAIKAITSIPGWQENLANADKVTSEARAYMMVPLIYRAVKLRAASLASVPIHLMDGENEIDWPFATKFKRLIWQTEASLLLRGAAYWLKLSNGFVTRNLVHLNPFSIEQEYFYNEETGLDDYVFRQPITGRGPWGIDEVAYYQEYDPLQDTHPGVSSAMVALGDSQLLNYITRFAWHFFEGGAMPVTVLGFQNTSKDEAKRVESRITKAITKITNAFNVIGVKADHVSMTTLTPELKTLALPELYGQAKKNVGAAFGIPTTMLEDPAANRATADIHRLSFFSDTVRPEGEALAEDINDQVLAPLGYELKMAFDEMDVFQEDENQRSESLKALVESGIPVDLAVEILGFDLTEDQQARLVADVLAKAERAEAFANANPFQNAASGDNSGSNGGKAHTMHAHLGQWQKKAIKRLKINKSPAVEFTSDLIPDGLNGAILGALESARNAEDVYRIFDSIWGTYP